MLSDLEDILDRPANREFDEDDFSSAADRLLTSQALFRDDHGCRTAYEMIVRFRGYFSDLFAALGRELLVNERELVVQLLPGSSASRQTLKLDETVILLSLRAAYEQGVTEFSMGDYGEVETTSMAVMERWETWIARPRPSWARVREILKEIKRRHIIDLGDELADESGMPIVIRPAIRAITGDGYLSRIEAFLAAKDADALGSGEPAVPPAGTDDTPHDELHQDTTPGLVSEEGATSQ